MVSYLDQIILSVLSPLDYWWFYQFSINTAAEEINTCKNIFCYEITSLQTLFSASLKELLFKEKELYLPMQLQQTFMACWHQRMRVSSSQQKLDHSVNSRFEISFRKSKPGSLEGPLKISSTKGQLSFNIWNQSINLFSLVDLGFLIICLRYDQIYDCDFDAGFLLWQR